MKRRNSVWLLAIFVLMIVLMSCRLNLPGISSFFATLTSTTTPTPTPLPLPPTIVETVPPVGSEIPLHSLLTIYFSEKMDRASVEAALSADFPGGFIFSWVDDSTLTLAPRAAMPSNAKVTFTLAVTAKSTGGLALLEPIGFSYQTPGPLRISQVLPAPQAMDVSPDSAVVVSFDQPVVPLGADPATLPAGLRLEPATPGKGEWLNTSTYIFHADPGLSGGVRYTIRVNPKLVSTGGMPLDAGSPNTTWVFDTSLPRVEYITSVDQTAQAFIPMNEQSNRRLERIGVGPQVVLLDPQIEIGFNQPMDKASVEANFSFSGPNGKVPGAFKWNDKFSVLTFKPAALLERATIYTATVSGQARSNGGVTLGNDSKKTFQTIPAFGVKNTSFPSGESRPHNKGVAITFTAPFAEMSNSELENWITTTPKPTYGSSYVNGSTINMSYTFQPGQTYTITFSAHLKDRYGQELGKDTIFTFTEPDASPSLAPGGYLPVLFTRPEDPTVSVQAVNLNTLTVSSGSMSLDDFLRTRTDYNFWQSYSPADLQTWTVNPQLPRNDNQPVTIAISTHPLATGFYYTNIDSTELQYHYNNRRTLVVSNVNLTFKISATEALVWAVDLRTHTPVQNMPVTLYDRNGVSYLSGATDENGLWRGQLSSTDSYHNEDYAILGQPGDDQFAIAKAGWNEGVSPGYFGITNILSNPTREAYLYTDRPVYRPGDTVHYRAILRQAYDGRYTDAGLDTVTVTWNDMNGKISEQPATVSVYGTINGDFSLPVNAAPGDYSFSVAGNGEDISRGTLYFQVADYRKPEINLSVEISPTTVKSGQPLTATVNAEYFFGAPAPDLPFTWSLYTSRSYFSIPEFTTGIQGSGWLSLGAGGQFGGTSREGQGRTNADGTFSLPLNDIKVDDTSVITLEVTASESGGFPVSARTSATLHPENFYVGVRPDAWVGQAETPLIFGLSSVDWDKRPVSKPLAVAFKKIRWERQDNGDGNYNFTPVYTPVDSKSVTSGADGDVSVTFTPPDAGTYVLDVTSGDAHTQALVWVSGGQSAEWPNLPYQQLQLTANQDKYKPGETAVVFIPNPFNAPAQALLTTERSTFKSVEIISVPAEGYKFSLPMTDEAAPNIYVSVTLLGPTGVDFRQGYIDLPVDPSAFTLNVDLKATPEKAKPGDTLTLDLTVTDAKGQPVQGEFSMAVVDLAALALADPNSEDIVPAYYDVQPLGVDTGLTEAIYTRRVLYFPGGRGGGGGEGFMTLRSKFPDTAYWKADIVTNAQGQGRVTLTLPDNLTTWQVDTRGLSADTKVGQARVRVVTTKDLLIRPQTPRFLVVGDHAELAAMVNNTTNQALDATVSLQSTGFTLDDPAKAQQKVSLPANGRVRVAWFGLVQAVDAVDAIFSVTGNPSTSSGQSLQDASRPNDGPIPVLRYSAPQTFSTAGILTGASTRQEIIAVPRSFQPLGGNLQVELSPSMASVILGSLNAIESPETPWSSEQIVSSFLPNVATYRTLMESNLDDPGLTARLQKNLKNDLNHLLAYQAEDGGFKWTMTSPKSDPYLTAYVLFGLEQVSESSLDVSGIDIPGSLQKGRDYLLSNGVMFDGEGLNARGNVNQAIFTLYVLQNTGGLDKLDYLADLLYGVDYRDKFDPWAKALFALTMYSRSPDDERAAALLSDLESTAIRSATGAHWESLDGDWMNPGTPLFTTAIVVSMLAERDPNTPLLADAVRYLASQQDTGGRWASSYETTWIILALDKYMQTTGELGGSFSFSAALNGIPLAHGQASGPQNLTPVTANAPLTQLNLSGANSLLVSRQDGTGKLYYRAALTVDRPVETAPAIDRGIAVSRQFMDCSGTACQPVTSYQMKPDESGRIAVRLTITLSHDAYYQMVQDYIPAGSDILDSSLKTSQQGQPDQSVVAQFDPADPFGDGWGWWYFNSPQIYSDHILGSADYLPAGTYELTYTIIPSLAGQYRVLPAHAWQAYFPEVQGTSAGAVFEIKP